MNQRPQPGKSYLFLLSHARSYSTLLAHLLGSSPEIDGYSETHLRYRSRADLYRLRWAVRRTTGRALRGRWLLDKLLHNRSRSPYLLLAPEQFKVVIFLRSPRPALSSLLAMQPGPGEVAWTEHRACDYYVARLQRLRIEGEQLQQRALYFDAEAIVTRPEIVLGTLQAWLGLRTPLATSYRLFPKSGHVGYGDPGENILAGRVLDPAEHVHISAPLSPTVIAEAEAAYSRCRDVLQRSCRSLTEFSAKRWSRNAASSAAGARPPGGEFTPLRA